jgi:hypothetical protein
LILLSVLGFDQPPKLLERHVQRLCDRSDVRPRRARRPELYARERAHGDARPHGEDFPALVALLAQLAYDDAEGLIHRAGHHGHFCSQCGHFSYLITLGMLGVIRCEGRAHRGRSAETVQDAQPLVRRLTKGGPARANAGALADALPKGALT